MSTSNLELPTPQLNPRLNQAFASLCVSLPETEVVNLSEGITAHVQAIKDALHKNEFLDLPLAEAIATTLLTVLSDYGLHSETNRALIVGAARYFIQEGDIEPDTSSVLGLDDDAEVLNYVLDTIGQPELKVEV